jgi:hypothetical protein
MSGWLATLDGGDLDPAALRGDEGEDGDGQDYSPRRRLSHP